MLELCDIHKTYSVRGHEVHAVAGVSLSLQAGEFVAVTGPSGCGKSTLLMIAGGLLAPDRGECRVAGQNPCLLSPDARSQFRAAHVGFVFQQFHLVPYLSVMDNVMAPTLAIPMERSAALQRARELLAEFRLEHRLQHVPSELSSGERQRVALARAVFNRPKLLLADEPTGNLDAENAAVVLDHLAAYASAGATVLLVTHDPSAAARAARTIMLCDGRIVPAADG